MKFYYACQPGKVSVAGIMALCATSSYYDINEIATRILPNVVVLTIDPDRSDIPHMMCNYLILVFSASY